MVYEEFRELVWQKGNELYRDMPWRQDTRLYYVLVSELMLQQTQVDRVIPKFKAFIQQFPDEKSLASASLADVLVQWQGLGYNRRAKFLHEAAKQIISFQNVPDSEKALMSLPGVGKNTAGAILAYTYNYPSVFIETNIRTVFFHHFFEADEDIDDSQIAIKLKESLDIEHPREFYWALMDYGFFLKRKGYGRISKGRHYKKQSVLKGSLREVRGQIVSQLTRGNSSVEDLRVVLGADERFEPALAGLIQDGLVTQSDQLIHLTK